MINKADIVKIISHYISLNKKGNNYVGVCPFHADNNPSLSVNPQKKIFKCFSCGEGGNAITFIMKYEKCDFKTAYNRLIEIEGFSEDMKLTIVNKPTYDPYDEKQRKQIKINEAIQEYLSYRIKSNIEGCLDYVQNRGLNEDVQKEFGIGYLDDVKVLINLLEKKYKYTIEDLKENDFFRFNDYGMYTLYEHRITLPIYDKYHNLIGFAGRKTDYPSKADMKYINPATTDLFKKEEILFNFYNAKEAIGQRLYIVEGYMDVIAMAKGGYKNTVALMGTALTKSHINLLNSLKDIEVTFVLDGDKAGQMAMYKSYKKLCSEKINATYVILPDGKDPDDILQSTDHQGMDALLENRLSGFEFALKFYEEYTADTVSFIRKKEIIKEMMDDFVKSKHDDLDTSYFLNALSKDYGLDEESIRNYYKKEAIHHEAYKSKYELESRNEESSLKTRYADRRLSGFHKT